MVSMNTLRGMTLHFSKRGSIFILLRLGFQSGWSDFAEIDCKVWPLSTIYFTISFNKIFFLIGFLQKFIFCAQKTEMDEISKFKFDLNRWLGMCQNALQYKNIRFSFKKKKLVCFWTFLALSA